MPEDKLASPGRRATPLVALLLAIVLLSVAVAAASVDHGHKRDALERRLAGEAREQAAGLEHYFKRSRALTALTARNPAFREFYERPGERRAKILARGREIQDANQALSYLEALFPGSIGEACFIDRGGAENARAVRGRLERPSRLTLDETKAPFFRPTFRLQPGQVYQARPYLSPDTHEWVIANSTTVAATSGRAPAIVHFEVTLESFRRQAAQTSEGFAIAIVEANSGRVIVDSRHPQPAGAESLLGRPADDRFARFVSLAGRSFGEGAVEVGGRPSAFRRLDAQAHNANQWVVVASAGPTSSSWVGDLGITELALGVLALLLLSFAILSFRASQAKLHEVALTDPLVALGNRRRLVAELESGLASASSSRPLLLVLFDLDGFKGYNDTFGHGAGDALLIRLAARLAHAVEGRGTAFRMGGDEFCVLAGASPRDALDLVEAASQALTEQGEGFSVSSSHGSVLLPAEATEASDALRVADQRMYARKGDGRASAGRQTTDALLRLLSERHPDISEHLDDVTALCALMADKLVVPEEDRGALIQAASLHDIGKAAIPDAILDKPGPLEEDEWSFIRQHTVIGERILAAAPALANAAKLVRWSHERVDGTGYPDGLAGEDIPLGARIIAVCDSFDAMTSSRPYRPTPLSVDAAIAELRRVAGTQLDDGIVEAFCEAVAESLPVAT